jgi:hypothetical protein
MADIGLALRIKYGLREEPSALEARQWIDRTQTLHLTTDAEEAGLLAATQIFSGVGSYILRAEFDTVEALLDRARRK